MDKINFILEINDFSDALTKLMTQIKGESLIVRYCVCHLVISRLNDLHDGKVCAPAGHNIGTLSKHILHNHC
jgi:hypothetical protein